MNRRRLYRSERDRVIAGVCAGVADYFDVDPTLVRVLWVVLSIAPLPFSGLVLYIVMAIVVPEESDVEPRREDGWSGPSAGYPATYVPPASGAGAAPGEAAADTTQTWTPDTAAPPHAGSPVPPSPSAAGPAMTSGWTPGPGDSRALRREERRRERQERWEARREARRARRGNGGLLFGLLLILVGGLLLWHQLDPRLNFDLAWPVVLVLFGVILIAGSVFPGRRDDG